MFKSTTQRSDTVNYRQRYCCKTQESIENREFGPCKTVTPENFSSKLRTRDYVGDTTAVQIYVQISVQWELLSEQVKYNTFCDFFDCPVLSCTSFLGTRPGRTVGPIFTARLSYVGAFLGVVILCPSVRLSVTRVLCDKTKQCTADILIPHERATQSL